jgi:hypothetical protein
MYHYFCSVMLSNCTVSNGVHVQDKITINLSAKTSMIKPVNKLFQILVKQLSKLLCEPTTNLQNRRMSSPPHRGCAGGRIGTRFLRPRGTSPLKGVNPAGTPGIRNVTESFFDLNSINSQPIRPADET